MLGNQPLILVDSLIGAVFPEVRWQTLHYGWEPVTANLARHLLYYRAKSDVLRGDTNPCRPLAGSKSC